MTRRIVLSTCILVLGCIQMVQSANCYNYNGGYFYTATSLGQSCATVCSAYGGFDAIATQRTGNAVGRHFYPLKSDGSNWMSIECSSTDSNINWGSSGVVPDPNWSHPYCYVHCACNSLPPNVDSCDGDPCNGVTEGGECHFPQATCGSGQCLQGVCNFINSTDAPSCGTDTQCRAYSCVEGECMATSINNNQPCTPDFTPIVSPCQEYVCSQGECVSMPANEGGSCDYDTCTDGICSEGACISYRAKPDGTQCSTNNVCSLNDVCSFGTCVSNGTKCGQCSSCDSLTGCHPLSNVTCDDGDDMTCDDTCQQGVCVGQTCPAPEASPQTSPIDPSPSASPSAPSASPTTTAPASIPTSATPTNSVVSGASLMVILHLLFALSALF